MRKSSIERILDNLVLDDNTKNIVKGVVEYYKTASYTDALTGAYNKRFIFEKIQFMSNFYACMIDINNFKNINDKIGHVNADLILVEISKIMQNVVNRDGYVIRFGGDEFVLIIKEHDLNYIQKIINNIIIRISDKYSSHIIHPTISYGIANSKEHTNVINVIKLADENMYKNRKRLAHITNNL